MIDLIPLCEFSGVQNRDRDYEGLPEPCPESRSDATSATPPSNATHHLYLTHPSTCGECLWIPITRGPNNDPIEHWNHQGVARQGQRVAGQWSI